MQIDRHKFLMLALSMGLGRTMSGCIVEEHVAQSEPSPTGGDEAVEPVVVSPVLAAPVAETAPADECVEWTPSGECIGWADDDYGAVAEAPTSECVEWAPSGECTRMVSATHTMAPAYECIEWDPSGECIGWTPTSER